MFTWLWLTIWETISVLWSAIQHRSSFLNTMIYYVYTNLEPLRYVLCPTPSVLSDMYCHFCYTQLSFKTLLLKICNQNKRSKIWRCAWGWFNSCLKWYMPNHKVHCVGCSCTYVMCCWSMTTREPLYYPKAVFSVDGKGFQ